MAIFSPSESPAIVVKETDLTGGVPNVQTTTGAFCGNFRWGPINQATLIDNEASLADKFGTPDDTYAVDFHTASSFLRYSELSKHPYTKLKLDRNRKDTRSFPGVYYPGQ